MIRNITSLDRVIRIIIAAVLAILFFRDIINGVAGIVLMVAAIILFMTAVVNFCPLYRLFGIRKWEQHNKTNA